MRKKINFEQDLKKIIEKIEELRFPLSYKDIEEMGISNESFNYLLYKGYIYWENIGIGNREYIHVSPIGKSYFLDKKYEDQKERKDDRKTIMISAITTIVTNGIIWLFSFLIDLLKEYLNQL